MRDIFESKSFLKLLAEVVLVALGVFLALLADQWREDRQHRENAREILNYFHDEIAANQKAVQSKRAYHEKLLVDLQHLENGAVPKTFKDLSTDIHFAGLQPIIFEKTAWELALASHSFSYLDPPLAYAISRVYTHQQEFQALQNSFLQSAFTPSTFASPNTLGLINAMETYLIEVNIQEPKLLKLYGDLLPQIEAARSHPTTSRR